MIISEAIKDFMDDRKYRNVSEKTLETYEIILRLFKKYLDNEGAADIKDILSSTIKGFLLQLQEKGNYPVSRNSKLRGLKIFFNYCESIDLFSSKENPTKRVQYAKEDIELKPFTDEQISQMIGYLKRQFQRNKSFVNKRHYMCVVFLLGSGVRVGELVNIKWSDVDFSTTLVSVLGKKREVSSVPVSDKLMKELELAEYNAPQR